MWKTCNYGPVTRSQKLGKVGKKLKFVFDPSGHESRHREVGRHRVERPQDPPHWGRQVQEEVEVALQIEVAEEIEVEVTEEIEVEVAEEAEEVEIAEAIEEQEPQEVWIQVDFVEVGWASSPKTVIFIVG